MPHTPTVPLGPATTNRKWFADVNTGTIAVPIWTRLRGIGGLKPLQNPTTQDTTDYDSEGWKGSAVTALEWGLELKAFRKTVAGSPASYDPAQEALRIAAGKLSPDNSIQIRYWEYSSATGPLTEAYQGMVVVTWEPDGDAVDGVSQVSVKLMGDGKRTAIANPST